MSSDVLHLSPLETFGLIELRGPDSARFLQGQLTCDVTRLAEQAHTLGACCNPKGRMLALFRLLRAGPEHFLMKMPVAVADALIEHLSRYKAFFRQCSMTRLPEARCFATWSSQPPSPALIARLRERFPALGLVEIASQPWRAELWFSESMDPAALTEVLAIETPTVTWHPEVDWLWMEHQSGLGQIYPETIGHFIPQALNLQKLGGISLDKGCYTGQEIVARTHYLGKLKKSMQHLQLPPDVQLPTETPLPPPGGSVYTPDGPVGEVVSGVRGSRGISLLVVLDTALSESGTLFLDANGHYPLHHAEPK